MGYGNGWWWWWVAFVVIFFVLPLAYGWGYRGWGPWYQRGPARRRIDRRNEPSASAGPSAAPDYYRDTGEGWGWIAAFLWIVLAVAIIWAIAAWGWGYGWW